MDNNISNNKFFKNIILTTLKLFVIFISLLVYKYVYEFTINQEMILKLFTIIALNLWIVKLLSIEEGTWCRNKVNLPIYLYIIIMSISLAVSNRIMVSLRDYIIFISYIVIYFLTINNIYNKKEFNSFIKILFMVSFIISLYTLIQYYGFDPLYKNLGRLTSTIGQKNWISNYLSMIFPVIFSYFLLEKIRKNKVIYYFILSFLYTTLLICQSRGIWISIGLTIILAIYIIFKFKLFKIFQENQKWIILFLVTILSIPIVYSTDNTLNKSAITVPQRAMSTFDEEDISINLRLLAWGSTLDMIKDRLLFGSGIGTFKINYLEYQANFLQKNPYYIKYSGKTDYAHNEYLQMVAELGILGLGIFLSIIFVFYSSALNYLEKKNNDENKIIILGLLMGITCFLIHCLFAFPLHAPALGSVFFILLGLTVVYIEKDNFLVIKNKNTILRKIYLKNKKLQMIFIVITFFLMILMIEIIVVKPYIAEIFYFKGIKYNMDKKYDRALPNFEYATQLDPYNGRILHALGTTYYNLGIQDEAQKVLQRTKYYFNDRNTFRNLGLSYTQTGNYEDAEKELKHAIYFDPKFMDAYLGLAYLYAVQKNYDKAIIEWNNILEMELNFSEKYTILYYIGLTYQKKEMPDKALEYFLEALQLVPEGSPIIEELEKEIFNIYKSKLEN